MVQRVRAWLAVRRRLERHQAVLEAGSRKRVVGAGAKRRLVFIDRLLATLVHLCHGATHDVLACLFEVDRSTITRTIGEMRRPLLAIRGCTIATGVRRHALVEVIDHLGASGQTGIIDGTEVRVRRPAVGRSGVGWTAEQKPAIGVSEDHGGKLCRHYTRPTDGPGTYDRPPAGAGAGSGSSAGCRLRGQLRVFSIASSMWSAALRWPRALGCTMDSWSGRVTKPSTHLRSSQTL